MKQEHGTAETLIQVARAIFAAHGYEGASVRAITAEAGANLGAITYHFGSKRELYDRVVASVVLPLAERVEQAAGGEGPVLGRVERVVRSYFEYLAGNPDLPQLMMQELVMAAAPPEVLMQPLKRVHAALLALVAEGQARGEVREGPARAMAVFILSVPVHLAILQRALARHAVPELAQPEGRLEVVEAAVSFVREGLKRGAQEREG
jgi:TetR/AcrR family transcriptional regulator